MDHQAFAQLLGNYGEFLGAIAVFATLVYLAIQIRQNTAAQLTATELAKADVTYKTADGYSRFYQMLADEGLAEIWAKAHCDEELSATDEVRLRAMVSELTYAGVAAGMNGFGVVGGRSPDAPSTFVAQEIGTSQKMRRAWSRIDEELRNGDLGEFAEQVAARLPPETFGS